MSTSSYVFYLVSLQIICVNVVGFAPRQARQTGTTQALRIGRARPVSPRASSPLKRTTNGETLSRTQRTVDSSVMHRQRFALASTTREPVANPERRNSRHSPPCIPTTRLPPYKPAEFSSHVYLKFRVKQVSWERDDYV